MKVTLGGDRLGSGNKNKIALRNYERSTHNLSQRWTSSMGAGILYPFLCIPAMRGDSFEIDLEAAARTIPTKGPLFGSFKMQMDVFQCPVRLYQAILHNNPTAIGLKMNQVMFPILELHDNKTSTNAGRMSESCLLKYLGFSGLGRRGNLQTDKLMRTINAIPALAYYDIFKNYYSNKQEENAYVIAPEKRDVVSTAIQIKYLTQTIKIGEEFEYNISKGNTIEIEFAHKPTLNEIQSLKVNNTTGEEIYTLKQLFDLNVGAWSITKIDENIVTINIGISSNVQSGDVIKIENNTYAYMANLNLNAFKLKNIDDMRLALLSHNNLGNAFRIGEEMHNGDWNETSGTDGSGLPYATLFNWIENETEEVSQNQYALNGLMIKTYQSDLFNNWINTEWIDGENGIAEITKIAVTDGAFKIDALNLAEKLYNMLNRVAVSGGTYEEWQDAVYTQSPRRHIESPVYLGGMSSEIIFEEIVQTAPAEGDPLGTLGGRGNLIKRKGGNVDVKVDEASFIIGIVSLTPRIMYSQGNEWYLTELMSMDDLHKPALDGIGFQELIGERLAWFDTICKGNNHPEQHSVGKVPAWIEYMTAVDKCYGDFAQDEGKSFMVLNRNYEQDENGIKDVTTYIDPSKYNYAFAYTELDAQNFWVQIQSNIRARRLMSAKQIPNV